jgi:hypothetical protein
MENKKKGKAKNNFAYNIKQKSQLNGNKIPELSTFCS